MLWLEPDADVAYKHTLLKSIMVIQRVARIIIAKKQVNHMKHELRTLHGAVGKGNCTDSYAGAKLPFV